LRNSDLVDVLGRRWWLVLLVAAVGSMLAFVTRPLGLGESATYSAAQTLVVAEGEDPEIVVLYAKLAEETSQIDSDVAAGLGEGVFGTESTSSALGRLVSAETDAVIGTLTLTAASQPTSDIAVRVVGDYATSIERFALERHQAEGVRSREALDLRIAVLADDIDERKAELEADFARQSGIVEQTEGDAAEVEAPSVEGTDDGVVPLTADELFDPRLEKDIDILILLQREARQLDLAIRDDSTPLRRLGPATVQEETVESGVPWALVWLAAGAFASLAVGVMLALVLNRIDSRVRSKRAAERAFALPVLAEVPRMGRRLRHKAPVITRDRPAHPVSDAYRLLRSSLSQVGLEHSGSAGVSALRREIIAIVSANSSAGRSTVVANLAVAYAATGKRVLVVNADLRNPLVHEMLGVPKPGKGLSDAAETLMTANKPVNIADYLTATTIDRVTLLGQGRGSDHPGETLNAVRPMVQACRPYFDVVLIDTPPMVNGGDVLEILPISDLVVVVARSGRSTVREGRWTWEITRRFRVPTYGLVLVGGRAESMRRGAKRSAASSSRSAKRSRKSWSNSWAIESSPVANSDVRLPDHLEGGGGSKTTADAIIDLTDGAAAVLPVDAPAVEPSADLAVPSSVEVPADADAAEVGLNSDDDDAPDAESNDKSEPETESDAKLETNVDVETLDDLDSAEAADQTPSLVDSDGIADNDDQADSESLASELSDAVDVGTTIEIASLAGQQLSKILSNRGHIDTTNELDSSALLDATIELDQAQVSATVRALANFRSGPVPKKLGDRPMPLVEPPPGRVPLFDASLFDRKPGDADEPLWDQTVEVDDDGSIDDQVEATNAEPDLVTDLSADSGGDAATDSDDVGEQDLDLNPDDADEPDVNIDDVDESAVEEPVASDQVVDSNDLDQADSLNDSAEIADTEDLESEDDESGDVVAEADTTDDLPAGNDLSDDDDLPDDDDSVSGDDSDQVETELENEDAIDDTEDDDAGPDEATDSDSDDDLSALDDRLPVISETKQLAGSGRFRIRGVMAGRRNKQPTG